MTHRVRSVVAALFALSLVLQAPVAFAAARQGERDLSRGFIERVIRTIKQVLKPLAPATNDDDTYYPTPPRP